MTTTTTEEAIFDASSYDLEIPKLDGHKADRLILSFGGQVELDRTDEDALEMLKEMRLGRQVRFTVEAVVAGKGFAHAAKGEDEEQVGYQVRLKVHSVEPSAR